MGNNQSGTNNWNMDDLAFGTAANVITAEEIVTEVSRIRSKYFGGDAVENDPSMHQMQNDLLAFDESLKRLFFRRKKSKPSSNEVLHEEYYYEDQQPTPAMETYNSINNQHYLEPTFLDKNLPSSSSKSISDSVNDQVKNTNTNSWRCSNCTAENKITDHVCRRCKLAETQL
ncbi:unnamed protein product [Rotaria sp. Silwood1]|nr:unnamed protein product [Rotaria sp. Silwood1]CAF1348322.1 unnamed protein product [Rotaria sp. Silwood1]CAF3622529.1 unnamed protein product [Rotaria sp. Silwood1]CAF4663906.1 unnamed protein product [Rotaria sp. Silwood1]